MFVLIAANSNLAIITVTTMVVSKLHFRHGQQKRVWVPVEKIFSGLQQVKDELKIFTSN
jgi:hypothetical protein